MEFVIKVWYRISYQTFFGQILLRTEKLQFCLLTFFDFFAINFQLRAPSLVVQISHHFPHFWNCYGVELNISNFYNDEYIWDGKSFGHQ